MYAKCLCFKIYPQRFYPYPLKFQALIEKEVIFQFTQKFRSRSSENDKKLTEKMHKKILQYQCFFIFCYHFYNILKKQAPKIPDFNTNQNLAFNIASSIEGLSTANQDPVVQSMVSLMSSIRGRLVKYFTTL